MPPLSASLSAQRCASWQKGLMLWRARLSQADEDVWLGPLRKLAKRLTYPGLCIVLEEAQPAAWLSECKNEYMAYQRVIEDWFEQVVVRYLLQERHHAVRTEPLRAPTRLSQMTVRDPLSPKPLAAANKARATRAALRALATTTFESEDRPSSKNIAAETGDSEVDKERHQNQCSSSSPRTDVTNGEQQRDLERDQNQSSEMLRTDCTSPRSIPPSVPFLSLRTDGTNGEQHLRL